MGKKYDELMKLKGKITEEGETIKSVSEKAGMNRNKLAGKLEGRTAFNITEIYKIVEILNIDSKNINQYFFTIWL